MLRKHTEKLLTPIQEFMRTEAASGVILAKLGFASQLRNKANLRLIHGLSLVAGIGFTMSLFVAGLSFVEGPLFEEAKLSILAASAISGAIGYALLRRLKPA